MEEPALHDTYYVVLHTPAVFVFTGLAAGLLAIWVPPRGLLARKAARWRVPLLFVFFLGAFLGLLPGLLLLLFQPESLAPAPWMFHWANSLALVGLCLMVLAILATLAIFVREMFRKAP